jgi:hypothetical protein
MSESLIAQSFGNYGAHLHGQPIVLGDIKNVERKGQIESFSPLPDPVEVIVGDSTANIDAIKDNLVSQLVGFEDTYAGSESIECEEVFQHFAHIVEMIDGLYHETRQSLHSHLSEVQINTIRSATFERVCSAKIDAYLKRLDVGAALRVENVVYALMNGRHAEDERSELIAKIADDLELLALLKEYESASLCAAKYTAYFKRLQEHILAYRDLKFWVRLKISQSYARSGYSHQARKFNINSNFLGVAEGSMLSGSKALPGPDQRFMSMYEQLLEFKAKYGHCDVPSRYKANKNLAIWVANVRARHKRKQISEQRLKMLERIGFCWTAERSKWQKMFEALNEFIAQNGHSIVPMVYDQCPELAVWIRNLRKDCRKGVVSKDKVEQLARIGFTFEVLDRMWFEKVEELRAFRSTYGHCRVPNRWAQNPSLARWVHLQRQRRKDNSLPESRVALLDSMEFEWAPPKGRPKSL